MCLLLFAKGGRADNMRQLVLCKSAAGRTALQVCGHDLVDTTVPKSSEPVVQATLATDGASSFAVPSCAACVET
jgi:hypothetical protein